MKRIIYFIVAAIAALSFSSCNPSFEVENTATVNLAGNWMCVVYYAEDGEWVPYSGAEFITYNTAENIPTQMWIDDQEGFWGTLCKIDCDADAYAFGKEGVEYDDLYNEVHQKIWGGKVTVDGAVAPGTETVCDKIEFFISFEDDEEPYGYTYYVAGYRRTGFPEDDDNFIEEWDSMPAAE